MPSEKITFEDSSGVERTLPGKFEVCSTCRGKGSHSLRFGAISAEDFMGPDWDEDSREAYCNGDYDARCDTCGGDRVVLVVDRERANPVLLRQYDEIEASIQETYDIQRSEMMAEMGAAYFYG